MFSLSRIASLVILFTCASEAIAGQKLVMASNAKEPALRSGSMLSENNDLQQEDDDDDEDVEKIIVQATRSGRIADEQPMRVEIINREEIMEKSTMRPGNISMLVAETGGVRVQTTSPALGSANIRLQGLIRAIHSVTCRWITSVWKSSCIYRHITDPAY